MTKFTFSKLKLLFASIVPNFSEDICMSFIEKSKILLIATFILGIAAKPSSSAIFNVASDFSLTNNPNGAWRYGWSSSLGSSFNLYSNVGKQTPTIDLWYDPTKKIEPPFVVHNSTASENNSHPTITYQPGQLGFHPGYYGEYSIVRWIAPEAGNYSLATTFMGLDHVGLTTTDVHVLHNNSLLFSNLINGFGASSAKSFTTTGTVQAGDTIDFAVGYGSNQTYFYDSTGLDVTISTTPAGVSEAVPEPSTALGGLVFSAFIAKMRMKRKRQQPPLKSTGS
jgi:hypothetical protein